MEWNLIITIVTGSAAFLAQGATLIWRLASARSQIFDKIMAVEKELLSARLETAEHYIKKDAFQTVMTNLDSRLIRLEAKLDKALSLA